MKQGKRPNRRQREFIKSKRLNDDNWLVTKDLNEVMQVVHRVSGQIRLLYK